MISVGDLVASVLRRIGVTHERLSAAIGRDCGCRERATRLNHWGYRWQQRIAAWLFRARHIAVQLRYSPAGNRVYGVCYHLWMACRVLVVGR
jgi:hypothetical protein